MSVLVSYAVVGDRLAEATVGGELETVTAFDVTCVPKDNESFGVTLQRTTSPLLKFAPVNVVVPRPRFVPFTLQSYTYEMVSPSSSEAVPGVHVKVVFSNAVVGVSVTLTKVGTEFEIVIVWDCGLGVG